MHARFEALQAGLPALRDNAGIPVMLQIWQFIYNTELGMFMGELQVKISRLNVILLCMWTHLSLYTYV